MPSGFGSLAKSNLQYKQILKRNNERLNPSLLEDNTAPIDLDIDVDVEETVQQKRKRLFNKDTGSLQLDLSNVPLWIWNESLHEELRRKTNDHCCFVDMIGRPRNTKTGIENPLFPYQKEILDAIYIPNASNPYNDKRRYKHVMIKKARGAGATDLILTDMISLPLRFPHAFYNSQMAVVTGIRKSNAVKVIKRMKQKLYQKLGIVTDYSESVLDLNGCLIEAYPIKNPDTYRGLDNLKYLFFDECDSTPKSVIDDTFAAAEGFWAKNNPITIFNGTPNEPGGLMERIEKQTVENCNYKRLEILADKIVGYIITPEELELASTSPFYRREYWGEYKGEQGNFFPVEFLQYAAGLTDTLIVKDTRTEKIRRTIQRPVGDLTVNDVLNNPLFKGIAYHTVVGVDPAFNSSLFAVVVNKEIEGIVYAVAEAELQAPSFEAATEMVKQLTYHDFPDRHPKIFIDSGSISIPYIRFLKEDLKEYPIQYNDVPLNVRISYMKSPQGWTVCPIPFNKYGDSMNYQWRRLLELGRYRIDPGITPNLWLSMNSAKYNDISNKFDKDNTVKNDYFDCGRLCMCNIKIGDMSVL
jgi:hypothetical protein